MTDRACWVLARRRLDAGRSATALTTGRGSSSVPHFEPDPNKDPLEVEIDRRLHERLSISSRVAELAT